MIRFNKVTPDILQRLRHAADPHGHVVHRWQSLAAQADCRATGRIMPAPIVASRWACALLVLLALTDNTAFADTNDRADAIVAITSPATSAPASASRPGAAMISLVDTTAAIDIPAASLAATAPELVAEPVVIAAFGHALDAEHLEGQRGGAEAAAALPVSAIFANGAVTDNRAVDVITGSNTIRDGAFANASGFPIVIQNTGANVLIQSATIVNVQLH